MSNVEMEPRMLASSVTKRFGERTVLDVDRLEVNGGEILALMGPSGSGKTTLLRIMATLEPPSTGLVSMGTMVWGSSNGGGPGASGSRAGLDAATLLSWRRRVTYVSQNPVLFTGTVSDNLNLPFVIRGNSSPSTRRRAGEMLERLGLSSLADARVNSLSAGEAQRVALARALVARPEVLLLDEPTANLDPANVDLIEKTLTGAAEDWGPAVVLVTHNLFQARRLGRRTGLLCGGQLIEMGITEDVFLNPRDARTKAFVRGEMIF